MASSKKKASSKNAKKTAPKKAAASKKAKRVSPKKTASKSSKPVRKSAKPAKKQMARKTAAPVKKTAVISKNSIRPSAAKKNGAAVKGTPILGPGAKSRRLDPFTRAQKEKLLQLRDAMVDSMAGVAKDNLRSRAEGSEASAFGMHQADAGSDAYDRDFALSLLSQEQDALYEIDQALKRIELGQYGTCEMSGKPIPHARLEAIPFARFTVQCQSQLEKQNKASRVRQSVISLFGLTDEEGGDGEEEEKPATKDED